MAYDAARRVTVLFGGLDFANSGETWEWNGSDWARRFVSGPSPRRDHAMAYDVARGVTVLFGGLTAVGSSSETWEWNGNAWVQRVVNGPSARYQHSMAYDSARGVTVLFGGLIGSANDGETWEWNGDVWTRRATDGPQPRSSCAMAYDAAHGVNVLFGGFVATALNAETWGLGIPCISLSITSHPTSLLTCARNPVTFTVSASGSSPLAYQWRRGTPRTIIPGATSATYTIPSAAGMDTGPYDCIITNACGIITSSTAMLTICVADFDDGSSTGTCDGGVTIEDLLYYLTVYQAGIVRADIDNGSATGTPDGGVGIEDLLYYLARYNAGC